MAKRRKVVHLAIPAAFVGVLALFALWQVGTPPRDDTRGVGTGGRLSTRPAPLGPLTHVAEVLTQNAIGRNAAVDNVDILRVASARTLWIGAPDEKPAFVVLDPDVKRTGAV